MNKLWQLTMTIAVLYLLLRTPGFPGDALWAAGKVYDGIAYLNALRVAEAEVSHPGEMRIGPCNLSHDCREDISE